MRHATGASSSRFLAVRRAAGYDRILAGEKPVQARTKYELVLKLETAKRRGREIPAMLLARANGVIE